MESGNKYAIPFRSLKNGVHDFGFRVGGDLFADEEGSEVRGGEFDVRVKASKSPSAMLLEISIEGYAVVSCDRCLEDCRVGVSYEGSLAVRTAEAGEQEYDGETLWLSPSDDDADLSHWIYESVILSLPYRRVHPDGECNPEMMSRFTPAEESEPQQTEPADNE